MKETTQLKRLTKIWQEIGGLFWQVAFFLTNNSFYPRLEALLDQNPGLDFFEEAPSPLIAQLYRHHKKLNLPCVFDKVEVQPFCSNRYTDLYFLWGFHHTHFACGVVRAAAKNRKPLFLIESGFFNSADTPKHRGIDKKYSEGMSFLFDNKAQYFDATRKSRLEEMLNDKNLIISEQQKQRAKKCIRTITSTCLTKYNHQPIFTPQIGRQGVSKVLVIDQSYGDMSVSRGLANDETFRNMLDSAIVENPEADIIVKTHPDTLARSKRRTRKPLGYYVDTVTENNVHKLTIPINPIALLKTVDKVYVCTSQLGFEALLCGKEVHVFGMPFYAGWGLTKDRLVCSRRTHKRTLEEVFYIAYIMYTRYVNPATKSRCEIEEAMDYLLALRSEYFQEFGVRNELEGT